MTLNREARIETFAKPTTDELLLQVTYNANMQPISFTTQASTLSSLSGFADLSTTSLKANTSKSMVEEARIAPLRIIYTR